MTLEIKVDNKTNEALVRITKGFGTVILTELDARWLEKALLDFLPLEHRNRKTTIFQEALDREIDREAFYGA